MKKYKGAIFDLDGVLVDTARYHYLAWKRLADELGFDFTPEHNERLKGVSRMASLDILLEVGGLSFPDDEKRAMAAKKNDWYVRCLMTLDESALLPGARALLEALRRRGVKVALGSASKNAGIILDQTGIAPLFDAIIDGNQVAAAKPNPEVFVKGAAALGLACGECVVFEDSQAGLDAARAAHFFAVAVGTREALKGGDHYIANLSELDVHRLF